MHTVFNLGSKQDNVESIKEEVLRGGLEGNGIAGVLAQLRREHLEKAKHPPRKKQWP